MATTTSTPPAARGGTRIRVQKFGTFLSNMIMPNIPALIAWGLLTALFIDVGWLPNADLDHLAGDLVTHGGLAGDVDVSVLLDLHVGAARRAVLDLDLDLAGPAVGLRYVDQADVLGGEEAKGLHGFSSRIDEPCTGLRGFWSLTVALRNG